MVRSGVVGSGRDAGGGVFASRKPAKYTRLANRASHDRLGEFRIGWRASSYEVGGLPDKRKWFQQGI